MYWWVVVHAVVIWTVGEQKRVTWMNVDRSNEPLFLNEQRSILLFWSSLHSPSAIKCTELPMMMAERTCGDRLIVARMKDSMGTSPVSTRTHILYVLLVPTSAVAAVSSSHTSTEWRESAFSTTGLISKYEPIGVSCWLEGAIEHVGLLVLIVMVNGGHSTDAVVCWYTNRCLSSANSTGTCWSACIRSCFRFVSTVDERCNGETYLTSFRKASLNERGLFGGFGIDSTEILSSDTIDSCITGTCILSLLTRMGGWIFLDFSMRLWVRNWLEKAEQRANGRSSIIGLASKWMVLANADDWHFMRISPSP